MVTTNFSLNEIVEVTMNGKIHRYIFSWGQDDPRRGAIFIGAKPINSNVNEFDVRPDAEEPGAREMANNILGLNRNSMPMKNKTEKVSGVKINWIADDTIEFDLYGLTYRFTFSWEKNDPREGATLVEIKPQTIEDIHRLKTKQYATQEVWHIANEAFGLVSDDEEGRE